MNGMGISTEPALLNIDLPHTLIESPSTSTFLPDEEASICPLLSNNSSSAPLKLSHPLTPCGPDDVLASINTECKGETSSSSASCAGIEMDGLEAASANLFSKHNYQNFQVKNKNGNQDTNGHCLNGSVSQSKNTPSFVSWNWTLIRKCTFYVFISAMLAMCAIVVAMIVTLPKSCNPKTVWYRGGVFYEIFPASFQDSNNDGIGDIQGILNRVDYISSLGVKAVRLNSVFPSAHYPDDFRNLTSITEIAPIIGSSKDIQNLATALHYYNISLLLDVPLKSHTTHANFMQSVNAALTMWKSLGVDGFYLKHLEDFAESFDFVSSLSEWKSLIGPNRVLILNEALFYGIASEKKAQVLQHINLVDFSLNVFNGTEALAAQIEKILAVDMPPTANGPWIHWTLGSVDRQRISQVYENTKFTLATTIMQLMLPGTASIFYGDEIAIEGAVDVHNEHSETKHLHHLATMLWANKSVQFTTRNTLPWLPITGSHNFENLKVVQSMIELRNRSPSLYKNSICKAEIHQQNTQIRHSDSDIIIIERTYPRRHSFVSVTNLGLKRVVLDMTSMFYSGNRMLTELQNEKIFFKKFEIAPLETVIIKLDK